MVIKNDICDFNQDINTRWLFHNKMIIISEKIYYAIRPSSIHFSERTSQPAALLMKRY